MKTKDEMIDLFRKIKELAEDGECESIIQVCNSVITPKQQQILQVQSNVFEYFWSKYPNIRKGNKQKALKAYNSALNRGAKSDEILDGLMRYLEYLRADSRNMQYAKGCEAWLNDDRWKWEYKTSKSSFISNLYDAIPE